MSDLPPADWYTDPEDQSQYRYWDGAAWTEHRAPRHSDPSPDQAPALRGPGRLIADMFSLTRRRWRSCVAPALISGVAGLILAQLAIVSGNAISKGELDEVWDRISDPGFDPAAPEHEAYFQALEFDLAPVNFVPAAVGLLTVLIAGSITQAAVSRAALGHLRDQPLGPSEVLRLALRRVPRLVGLNLQVALILLVAVLVLVISGTAAPLLLIPLIPAFTVGAVYASVVVSLAYVVASVGPAAPSLLYGVRLVRGRFWQALGRMVLVFLALTAVTLAVELPFMIAWSSSPAFAVVSQVVPTVVAMVTTVVGIAAIAIIYHDLGGESD